MANDDVTRQRLRLFLGRFRRSADVAHEPTVLPDGRGILRYPGMRSAGLPGRILQGVELHRLDRAKDPAVRSGDRFAPYPFASRTQNRGRKNAL